MKKEVKTNKINRIKLKYKTINQNEDKKNKYKIKR